MMSFAGRRRARVAGSVSQPPGVGWGGPGVGSPPPDGEAFNANEPTGLALLGDKVWANGTSSAFSIDVGTSSGGFPDVGGAPEGGKAAQFNFPNGYGAGYRGSIETTALPSAGYSELFAVMSMRVSAGMLEDANGTKFFYPPMIGGATKPIFLCSRPFPGDATKYSWYFVKQAPTSANLHCNANGYSEASPYPCSNGSWYKPALYLRTNTANGVADGAAKLWISPWDGEKWLPSTLILNYEGIELNVNKFRNAYWDLYRGGAGTPAIVGDQFVQINRTYASGKVAA